jgi:hypothetical protein
MTSDIESGEPFLESVEQNQGKENYILQRCGCIMTGVNLGFIILLIICVIVGILKINNTI